MIKFYIIMFITAFVSPILNDFIHAKIDPFYLCTKYCVSEGQDNSKVIQDSMGTCICGNEEGYKVQKGYTLYINNMCTNDSSIYKRGTNE